MVVVHNLLALSPVPGGRPPPTGGIIVSIDSAKQQRREKLKDIINGPSFPTYDNITQWENKLARQLHLASGYDDRQEMIWLAVAFQPSTTFEDLTREEPRLKKISALLAYELEGTCYMFGVAETEDSRHQSFIG